MILEGHPRGLDCLYQVAIPGGNPGKTGERKGISGQRVEENPYSACLHFLHALISNTKIFNPEYLEFYE